VIENIELPLRVAAVQGFPSHHWIGKFKRAVLYALGIEAAISAEIDVFKEKTEQCFWNWTAGLVDLHGDVSRLSEGDLRLEKRNREKESEKGLS
jgi:hypothetical protein